MYITCAMTILLLNYWQCILWICILNMHNRYFVHIVIQFNYNHKYIILYNAITTYIPACIISLTMIFQCILGTNLSPIKHVNIRYYDDRSCCSKKFNHTYFQVYWCWRINQAKRYKYDHYIAYTQQNHQNIKIFNPSHAWIEQNIT